MGEWMYRAKIFLTSALDGGKRLVSRPGRFTAGEKAPGTPWIGGWVDPRNDLDIWRKFLALKGPNSGPSVVQSVASRYTDCVTPATFL
jgi:hypothetical protein